MSKWAFPVFAKGLSIRGTAKLYKGSIGEPVTIADTVVRNGDIIVGDRDGIVVIAEGELDDSLALAENRERKETGFRDKIAEGISTVELMGLSNTMAAYFPE